jgi:Fe-S cluster assembly protein SufD
LASPPAWAEEARQAADENLTSLPALTGREEIWRFTPPTDLALLGPEPEAPSREPVAPQRSAPGERAAYLRLDDGRPAAPEVSRLPDGVIVAELGAALAHHEALVRERLYGLVGFDDRPGALNAARWDGGTFVYVPRGVEVELPVEALLTASGTAGRVFGRTLVVVDDGAKATVIDRYESPDFDAPVNASSARGRSSSTSR